MRAASSSAMLAPILALAALSSSGPTEAAPARLEHVAAQSVLAVSGPNGKSTGFAFTKGDKAIVGATGAVQLIASTGRSASVGTIGEFDSLAIVAGTGLDLSPLSASPSRLRHAGTAYVLGPPLGYQTRIRPTHLPLIDTRSTRAIGIGGTLPHSFVGAPVVTRDGRLLGAIASIAPHRWVLAPAGRLAKMMSTTERPSGAKGWVEIVAGLLALLVLAMLIGLIVVRRKRRRTEAQELAARARRSSRTEAQRSDTTFVQPLVRRREGPAEDDAHKRTEDFEVIIKSKEGT